MSDFTAERILAARERVDVVALVRNHVALRGHGPMSFRGRCPLHDDEAASFYVHPRTQLFHCFACKTSGDAIAFLMNVCEWSIGEAVEALEAMPATRDTAESRPCAPKTPEQRHTWAWTGNPTRRSQP